jgi:hypothetical protein
VRPPQVPVGVGRLPGRHHAPGLPGLVHNRHLDAVQMVRRQSVLPAQEAESLRSQIATLETGRGQHRENRWRFSINY